MSNTNEDSSNNDEYKYFKKLRKNMTLEEQQEWFFEVPREKISTFIDREGNDLLMHTFKLELKLISELLITYGYINITIQNNNKLNQLMMCIQYIPSLFFQLYSVIRNHIKNEISRGTITEFKILSHINSNNETVLIFALKQYLKICNNIWHYIRKILTNKATQKDRQFIANPTYKILIRKKEYIEQSINTILDFYNEISDIQLDYKDNDGNTVLILAIKAVDYGSLNVKFFNVIYKLIDIHNRFHTFDILDINAINNKKETALSTFLELEMPFNVSTNDFNIWSNMNDDLFHKLLNINNLDLNIVTSKGNYLIHALKNPQNIQLIIYLIANTSIETIERKYKGHDILFYIKNKIKTANKIYKNYYFSFLSAIINRTGKYPFHYIDTNSIAINIIDRIELPIYKILTDHIANIVFKLGENHFYITFEQLYNSINNVKKTYYECTDDTEPTNLNKIIKSVKYFSIEDIIGQKGYVDFELIKILYENASIHQTIHQLYLLNKVNYVKDVISTRLLDQIILEGSEDQHFTLCDSKRGKIPYYEIIKAYPLSIKNNDEDSINSETNENSPSESLDEEKKISLKFPGDIMEKYVYNENSTIENIKIEVSNKHKIHIDNIRFMIKGKFLENSLKISEIPSFDVKNDIITVFLKREIIINCDFEGSEIKFSYMYNPQTSVNDIKNEVVKKISSQTGNENIKVDYISYMSNKLDDNDLITNILKGNSKEFEVSVLKIERGGVFRKKSRNKNLSKKKEKIRKKLRKTCKNK